MKVNQEFQQTRAEKCTLATTKYTRSTLNTDAESLTGESERAEPLLYNAVFER